MKYGSLMEITLKEYSKMIINKDKELIFGKIKINILDNLKKILNKDLVKLKEKMEIIMKVPGLMIKFMEKENL